MVAQELNRRQILRKGETHGVVDSAMEVLGYELRWRNDGRVEYFDPRLKADFEFVKVRQPTTLDGYLG